MGYACPVCETPHPDGEHLANHLAFTAMLGRTDHEAWLDDHAPDWESQGPDDLADSVAEHVPETEFPQMFDDTTPSEGHDHGHDARAPTLEDHLAEGGARGYGRGDLSGEADDVLQEARRMTAEMYDEEDDGDTGANEADEARDDRES